jgi:hypothetical protein
MSHNSTRSKTPTHRVILSIYRQKYRGHILAVDGHGGDNALAQKNIIVSFPKHVERGSKNGATRS